MCAICEQFGFNIHADAGENGGGGGGGDPQFDPTESFTLAEAAAHLNRDLASWNDQNLGTGTNVTYSFRNTDVNASEEGFTRFSANQITLANLALQSWADVANITFTRVSGSGPGGAYSDNSTMRFGNFDDPGGAGAAHAYLPFGNRNASSVQGDVWVNTAYSYEENPVMWEYGMQTLTHEIGHAIGFSHPGDYNAGSGGPITYADDAEFIQDTRMYTVMSYFDASETGADHDGFYSPAPLMIDIAAAQRLYGANLTFHDDDTTYGFNSNADRVWYKAPADPGPNAHAPIFCAWDAGGVDTFDFSGYAVKQTIDLRNGFFSDVGGMESNVSIAGAKKVDGEIINFIENAIGGSAVDTIIGNGANNNLQGRNGNDTLLAGKGDDAVLGGDGNDQLVGGKGLDTITGGLGQDLMTGQKHNDRFVFQTLSDSMVGAEDRIYGGLTRLDYIDLSGIDANTTVGGNQAFHFGGTTFDNDAGELIRFYHAGSNTTFFQGDVDGDDDADFSIAVTGDYTTHNAFVL